MKLRSPSLAAVLALGLAASTNIKAQVWEYTLSLPAPHKNSLGLTATNGSLLSVGGLPLEGNLDLVYELVPGASAWQKVHRLTNDASGIGTGIDGRGRIIVFGGIPVGSVVPLTNGYVYETAGGGLGAVAAIAPKNFAVYNFALATDDQHRIYAIGGKGGFGLPGADSLGVERYDALSDSWAVLAPLPSPRYLATAVYDGLGHILLFGGINPRTSTLTSTVFSYDIASDSWSQLADVPTQYTGPVNNGAGVLGADGRVYLVGPGTSVFDPVSKVWFAGPLQKIVRGAPGATLGSDGFVYLMGGENTTVHGGLLDAVERLDTLSPLLPALVSRPVTNGLVGVTYSYQVIASGIPRATFAVVDGPAGLGIDSNTGLISWTPDPAQAGTFPVTIRAANASGSADQSYNVSIASAANRPPVAAAQSLTTPEDTPASVMVGGTDPDANALTFAVVTTPAHGTLTGTPPNLTYTPALNYNGPDSFTFTANDGSATSAPATISIAITPVNDPPVATPQSVTTAQDVAIEVTVAGTDVDADELTFAIVTGPVHGALSGTPPNLTYTPAPNYSGPDTFTFTAKDAVATSDPATVSLNVTPVSYPPAVLNGALLVDGFKLTGNGMPGRTYGIEVSGSLVFDSGSWLRIGAVTADGSGAILFTDTNLISGSRFYRAVYP